MRRTLETGIRAAAILVLLAAVAACSTPADGDGGDDDGGDGATPGTRDVGYIVVDELDDGSLAPATVNGDGGFARFDADVPGAYFSAPWDQLVGTCDVTTLDFDDPFEGLPFPGDLGMTFLEAGDTVDVTAGGDLYVELDRMETTFDGDTIVAYGTTDDVAGPLAENLALDVPGDEFPAVANAAFPDAAPFDLTAPADPGADGSVDVDTTFEWSGASDDANTIVSIGLVASDRTTFVTCYAADTGSFALPDATKTELDGAFSGFVEGAGRESVRVETIGDARLLLVFSRAQTFSTPIILPPFPTQR